MQDEDERAPATGRSEMGAKRKPLAARRPPLNRKREAPLSERQQAEGIMAKERLIKALQITSSKLDFVQKKVRGKEGKVPSS